MMVKAVAVFPGVMRGRACVVLTRSDLSKVTQGDVVVIERATPLFSSIYKKAAALLVGTMGALSHAAIIAREYKIPCVADMHDITALFHDGDVLVVDGAAGTVEKIMV